MRLLLLLLLLMARSMEKSRNYSRTCSDSSLLYEILEPAIKASVPIIAFALSRAALQKGLKQTKVEVTLL